MSEKQRNWVVATGLFLAAVALAVPFRSRTPYHWDCAEFAIAVTHYDVRLSQPHAPGYFLYVMLGKLVNSLVRDPHASLVWISVFSGGGLAATMYFLGTALFDRRTGVIAGLLAMTSPLVWFHSCVALTYVLDGFLACVIISACWRAMQRGGTWGDAVLIGVLLAVLGGIRQQSVPALAPAVLYTFWRFTRLRLAKLAVAAATALGLGLAWFVPMVAMSDGLATYLRIVRLHSAFNASATFAGGGLDAFLWNVFFVGLFSANGLMLASIVLLGALLYRARRMGAERKRQWDCGHARALQVLAAWIAPMLLLATAIGFTKQPGYVLNFLPGLLLLAAVALANTQWPATLVVCAFNIFAFIAWPAAWDGVFFGTARTACEIRTRDRQLGDAVAAIRLQCLPAQTVVCHAGEYLHFGLRQFQLILPEFDQYQLQLDPTMLTPPGQPMMRVHNGQLEFAHGIDWAGKPVAVLVVPPDLTEKIFDPFFNQFPADRLRKVIHE
jgi:hypothetical protein